MRLAWHQFAKDWRQFRAVLVGWWIMLGADLFLNLWLPGQITYRGQWGFTHQGTLFFWGCLVALLWLGALGLPALAVQADSPIGADGFYRTRPVPRDALIGGKLLFLTLGLLGPACLDELLHLLLADSGWSRALGAAGERLLFLAPLMVATGAFGGLWRSRKALAAAAIALAIALWLTFLGLYLLATAGARMGWMRRWVDDPDASQLLLWSLLMVGGLGLLTAWAWARPREAWRRWTATLLLGVGALVVATLPAWNLFPVRPAAPDTVAGLAPTDTLRLNWNLVEVWRNERTPEGRLPLTVTLRPRLPQADPTVEVEWLVQSAELRADAGTTAFPAPARFPGKPFGWRGSLTEEDLGAFARLIGPDTLFLSDHAAVSSGNTTSLGTMMLDQPPTNAVVVHAELTGRVFHWVKAAQLPLQAGARSQDEAGTWTLLALDRSREERLNLGLRRDHYARRTAADSRFRRLRYWPASQHDFVLVDCERGVALPPDTPTWVSVQMGDHTAIAHRYLSLSVNLPREWPVTKQPELRHLELWILRREYLGELPATVESPRLDLTQLHPPTDESGWSGDQRLKETEFRRRLAELPSPPPDSNRVIVGHFLAQVLQLIEARRAFLADDDPLVARLADLVPEHLELFLDALAEASTRSARFLRAVILRGVPEDRVGEIVAALPGNLELAEIVLQRGWEERARPLSKRLVEAPGASPFPAIQLLVALDEPATYPRLLAELERRPAVRTYDLLRTLDGLRPKLDAALDRIWRQRPRLVKPEMGSFATEELLLHTGRREALARLLRLFHLVPEERRERLWTLLDAFRRGVRFEGLDPRHYHDHPELAAWLNDKQPEDFVWDPTRQLFRLRSALNPTTQP